MKIKLWSLMFTLILLVLTTCNTSSAIEKSVSDTFDVLNWDWAENLTLVWQDEFNGPQLDRSKWDAPNNIPRHGASHWMSDQVTLSNGFLRLGVSLSSGPPNVNYNCGAIHTTRNWSEDLFTQTFGYFEARCKLPDRIDADYWAAFWMMSGDVSHDQSDTQLGHEIDIMESFTISDRGQHKLTLHWNGYEANHNYWGLDCGNFPELQNNEFHVYGLYWDQNKFISYVDGVEVGRTDFTGLGENHSGTASNGPSRQPAYIKLSCEADQWPGGSGWEDPLPKEDEFLVDYVRVYTGTVE